MKITLYERLILSILLVRENTQTGKKVEKLYSIIDDEFHDIFAQELRSLQAKGLIEFSNKDYSIAHKMIAFVKSWFMQIKRPKNYQVGDLISQIKICLDELQTRDLDSIFYESIVREVIKDLSKKVNQKQMV